MMFSYKVWAAATGHMQFFKFSLFTYAESMLIAVKDSRLKASALFGQNTTHIGQF